MLNIQTKGIAITQLKRNASKATRASTAASKSPYAAGFAKRGSKVCAGTPGTRNARPMYLKVRVIKALVLLLEAKSLKLA